MTTSLAVDTQVQWGQRVIGANLKHLSGLHLGQFTRNAKHRLRALKSARVQGSIRHAC